MKLDQFILTEFKGSKKAAAEFFGVWPSQISKWVKEGDIVVNQRVYKERLKLNRGE